MRNAAAHDTVSSGPFIIRSSMSPWYCLTVCSPHLTPCSVPVTFIPLNRWIPREEEEDDGHDTAHSTPTTHSALGDRVASSGGEPGSFQHEATSVGGVAFSGKRPARGGAGFGPQSFGAMAMSYEESALLTPPPSHDD